MSERIETAKIIMENFLKSTGVLDSSKENKRYLWTDAFAVVNLIALNKKTGDTTYEKWAKQLVDHVHESLGKYRQDDTEGRTGWLSGLSEEEAALHPTLGGLRIGKPNPERRPDEAYDEDAEWDKDGQYYHYLTKWMIALVQMASHFKEKQYLIQAYELAKVAHKKFTFTPSSAGSGPVGYEMHWKMSTDLTRPLTKKMGAHDPLDGFLTYWDIEEASRNYFKEDEPLNLHKQRYQLFGMVHCTGMTDPLGLGGLLLDLRRVCNSLRFLTRFNDDNDQEKEESHHLKIIRLQYEEFLANIVKSVANSLALVDPHKFSRSAESRLAFREFGLAMGLISINSLVEFDWFNELSISSTLKLDIRGLLKYLAFAENILSFWLNKEHQQSRTWQEHEDINRVMLATCLLVY